jgi:probable O-glycosylation ligase (exosortase A-associated)
MRDVILLAAVAIASLVALRRPSFGFLTFALLGFVAPQSFMWGFGRTFPFSQVIAVSTVLGLVLSAERKTLVIQRESLLLILLWLLFGASTLNALYPAKALEQLLLVSKIFFMIIIATMVINSDEKLNALIRIVGYSLGFYGLKGGLFAVLSGGEMIVYGPEGSFLFANNSIGLGLAMNIPILLYLLKREESSWLRWTLRSMLWFTYPAIVCTYSRGAWLGMLVVTAMSLLKSRKKVILIGLACIVIIAVQVVLSQKLPDRLISRYDSLVNYEEDSSAQSRFWNWEFCKRVGLARPIAGGGFDLYGLESYAAFYPEFLERWPGKVWSCHNTWLTIFAEHGVSGSVIWLALVLSSLMSLRQIRAYGMTSGELHILEFSDMVQSSLLAYFVVGTFIDAAYFDILYYFIAFIMIQKSIAAKKAQDGHRSLVLVGSGMATASQIQPSVRY